jgi:hypothetical protein
MLANVAPGATVSITVKKAPTSGAAAKTLSRIFAKDPANRRLRARRKDLRTDETFFIRRGGRPWGVRPKAPRLVQPGAGDSCKVLATVDVLNDLGSVERVVDVRPSK